MKSVIGHQFVDAIDRNDDEKLYKLLEQYSPNTILEEGYTPLMLCCGESNYFLANILLTHGANVNLVNNQGTSAIKISVIKEDLEMLELLNKFKANANILDQSGYSPIMYAVKNKSTQVIKKLLNMGADPFLKSKLGKKSSFDLAKQINANEIHELLRDNQVDKDHIKLEDLVGQNIAKRQLKEIISLFTINQERKKNNLPPVEVTLHSIYLGNPGTGKTTFARFFAQEIKKLGILQKGHLIEVSRNELIAQFVGQTAEKTKKVFESALDGILFIDEAYSLKNNKDDQFGQECINTLISLIENHRDRVIVILAGYKDEMQEFLHHNPGLKSRIPNLIDFIDFTNEELAKIMARMLQKTGMETLVENINYAVKEIGKKRKERSFGNAREVRNMIDRSIIQQSLRLTKEKKDQRTLKDLKTLIFSDFTSDPHDIGTYEELYPRIQENQNPLESLNRLVGMTSIKNEINGLVNFVEISKMRNPDKLPEIGLHMIFTGNPGTGKTTVARLLGKILKELDLLSSGHVVEADRSMLVAPYVGQTAIKTKGMIDKALGGILFIDEAYTLYRSKGTGNDFGVEAIDTILKYMEDFRDRFVVVLAGYPKEMEVFLTANSGLKSRFNRFLDFPDFSALELSQIARFMAQDKSYALSESAEEKIIEIMQSKIGKENFGNARDLRNIIERSYKKQASRLVELKRTQELSEKQLNTLEAEDFI